MAAGHRRGLSAPGRAPCSYGRAMPRHPVSALAAACVLLAACSGDADDPATLPPSTVTVSSAPTTAAATTAPAGPAAPPTTEAPPTTTARLQLARFQTPTGNIACDARDGEIRCDILDKTWAPPPRPADCEFDWGVGLAIRSDGTPAVTCASDTVADPGLPRLAYGTATAAEGITCISRTEGLTCTSDRTRRGFFLSRGRYALL